VLIRKGNRKGKEKWLCGKAAHGKVS
jgi:hypothetical protein